MQTTIKSFCISIVLVSTILSPNVVTAQNLPPGEQREKILSFWSLTMQQVQVQAGASQQEYDIFSRFERHTIDSVRIEFIHKVNDNTLGINNVSKYMMERKPFFINLFNNFRKIEAEFPSSVDEYKAEPKLRPGGDSCFSTCYNTGFEDGTLDGWYGYYAVNNSPTSGPFNITNITGGYCGHVTQAGGPDPYTSNDYQIHVTSGSNTDYFLRTYSTYSLPQVSPYGGRYSVMIGDSNINGQGTAILSQSFMVTNETSSLTYQFAVFLERLPTHTYSEQPLFSVTILNQFGDTIPGCGNYKQSALRAGEAGFNKTYYPVEGDSVYWKPWTFVNVPLKKYIGQCVTIVFEVWDCSQGGHFGYAYVDASCSPLQILSSSPNFCGQDSITLTAPPGDSTYRWSGPLGQLYNGIRGSDSGQVVSIDSAGVYRLIAIPVTGVACADTLYDTIGKLHNSRPYPSFTADTVCAGVAMKFINTSHPDSGIFSWDFYNIGLYNYVNMNNDDTLWTYSSPGVYTVKLHELSAGCGFDTLIKVDVAPDIGPPSHTATNLCTGDSTLFTATAANAITYNWNFGDPASGPRNTSNLQNTGHVYPAAGTYTVTLKATNLCEADTSFTVLITATPKPVISGDTLICVNTTDVLTVTGGSTYVWNPGNHSGSSYTVIPSRATTYTVVASNGSCTHDTTFTVNTFPPPVTSVSPRSDTICAGQSVVITGSGIGVYKWSNGSTTTSISVNPVKTTKYYLRDSIKGSLCLDTASATIFVRTPLVTTISHDTSICPFQPVTISVTESDEPPIYLWSTGATGSSIIVTPGTTTTYTAIISGFYCYHDTLKTTVTVVQLPVPVIAGTDWKCIGIRDTLTVSSTTNPTTYVWDNGKTTTSITTGSIEADSVVTVTAYNSLGCPVETSYTITLRQPPKPSAITSNIFCAGQPITLTASAQGTNSPFTYKWSTGQTGSSITIDPGPTTATTYTVKASNGCIGTATTTATPDVPNLSACCNQTLIIESDSAVRNDTAILVAGGNSIKYQWTEQPDNGQIICLNPLCDSVKVITKVTTSYTVTGTDTNGCTTEQVLTVNIEVPCYKITIPNVFTPSIPGPEGLNSEFYIKTQDVDAWSLTIFDRWGKEVFKTNNQYQYWTGTTENGAQASAGVYYYIIDATCQNSTYKRDGFIQLIR